MTRNPTRNPDDEPLERLLPAVWGLRIAADGHR